MSNADIVDLVVGIIHNMLPCPEAKTEFERLGILKCMCRNPLPRYFHRLSEHYISSRIIQMQYLNKSPLLSPIFTVVKEAVVRFSDNEEIVDWGVDAIQIMERY